MNHLKKVVATVAMVVTAQMAAHAQTDAANLDLARKALDVEHKCDDALKYLNLVSPDSRLSADYILNMAKVQDCKQNSEQALYYYNKYLKLNAGNDSVTRRVAELTDQKNKKNRTLPAATGGSGADEAKAVYQTASKNKKRRRLCLTDNYSGSGMGYAMGLGGDKSPYKSALDFSGFYGFMAFHNKGLIDVNTSLGFLLSPNKTWFGNALQVPADNVGSVGGGFYVGLNLGLQAILLNEKSLALSAGPIIGFNLTSFPQLNSTGDIATNFHAIYGLRSNLYLGENAMFYLQLRFAGSSTASVSGYMGNYEVPTNYNSIGLGIAYKFDSWW